MSPTGAASRATATGRLATALVAGLVVAWLLGACGSGGASTKVTQAGHTVSTAVAQLTSNSTSTDAPPATTTTTTTETKTVTEPAKTVTRTQTTQSAPPTTSIANQTTSVAVTPATTAGEKTGDQIPWWGWLLIGLGAAAVAVGIFAAGHHRGTRTGGGQHGGTGMPPPPAP